MIAPASRPRDEDETRLLVVSDTLVEGRLSDLARWVGPGDVVVVNDAATLPGSLAVDAVAPRRSAGLELRLLRVDVDAGRIDAVLFGAGDHRTPTEHRPPPPADVAELAFADVRGTIARRAGRRVEVLLDVRGDRLVRALYRHGRPIQYAHVPEALPLWAVQTPYASRPWAVEMPSAGRALGPTRLAELRAAGARVVRLTHAAGLSSTGDPALDASLPLPERYEIPAATTEALADARRVIAVGTSVVRALEDSAARHGAVRPGPALATLRLDAHSPRRVVDAVLSGIHERGTSHHDLLSAFVGAARLDAALARADETGFLGHELGDTMLVVGRRPALALPPHAA